MVASSGDGTRRAEEIRGHRAHLTPQRSGASGPPTEGSQRCRPGPGLVTFAYASTRPQRRIDSTPGALRIPRTDFFLPLSTDPRRAGRRYEGRNTTMLRITDSWEMQVGELPAAGDSLKRTCQPGTQYASFAGGSRRRAENLRDDTPPPSQPGCRNLIERDARERRASRSQEPE